jgi:thymidylate kinase
MSLRPGRPGPFVVAIFGPDGSGKSTLAEALVTELQAWGVPCGRIHWRPGVLVPYRTKRGSTEDPHGSDQKSPVLGVFHLSLYLLDFLAHRVVLSTLRRGPPIVVAERYAVDVVVDPARYGLGGVPRVFLRLFSYFAPRPSLALFLEGESSAIRRRKPELPVEEIERQIRDQRVMAGRMRAVITIDTVRISIPRSVDLLMRELQVRGIVERRSTEEGEASVDRRQSTRSVILEDEK